jgi:DNA mismatch repair ATPase MutS
MHVMPQLDNAVIKLSAVLAIGLLAGELSLSAAGGGGAMDLRLGRMPRVMHVDAATARETLHVWPPASQGEAVTVGGTASNNSLYGLLAASAAGGGGTNAQRRYLATALGRRCWAAWLDQPCYDLAELALRQDAVAWLVSRGVPRDSVHSGLAALNLDVTQLAQQLSNHQVGVDEEEDDANAAPDASAMSTEGQQQPQPVGSTRKALHALYNLFLLATQKLPLIVDSLLSAVEGEDPSSVPDLLRGTVESLQRAEAQLRNAASLAEAVLDLDQAPREFLVKSSYRDELQDLHLELEQTNQQIDESVEDMNEVWSQTGGGSGASSQTVKLETTNSDGYQFRLADANAAKVLETLPGVRVHRILKNGVYFSTKDLMELSTKHADLIRQYEHHQRKVVIEAMPVAASFVGVLDELSPCLARLDVVVGLALLACHRNYCRPVLTDADSSSGDGDRRGNEIVLDQARHPCVELHMEFIPNSVRLERDTSSFMIVTGPNMVRRF